MLLTQCVKELDLAPAEGRLRDSRFPSNLLILLSFQETP